MIYLSLVVGRSISFLKPLSALKLLHEGAHFHFYCFAKLLFDEKKEEEKTR